MLRVCMCSRRVQPCSMGHTRLGPSLHAGTAASSGGRCLLAFVGTKCPGYMTLAWSQVPGEHMHLLLHYWSRGGSAAGNRRLPD